MTFTCLDDLLPPVTVSFTAPTTSKASLFSLKVFLLVLLAITTIFVVPSQAQVATGTYALGTFDAKGPDIINVGSLNVHLGISVLHKAGRGLPFSYDLVYDSSIWFPNFQSGTPVWAQVPLFGWKGSTDAVTGYVSYSADSVTSPDPGGPLPGSGGLVPTCTTTTYSNWVYFDSFGTSHPFTGTTSKLTHGDGDTCDTPQPTFSETAADGSGFTLSVVFYNQASISTASGSKIRPPVMTTGAGVVTDANGNQLSVDSSGNFTDTTGNIVLTVAGNSPSPKTLTYRDTSGNPQSVTVSYASYSIKTAFGCSGVTEYGPTSNSLVDRITFPDNSYYAFTYEPTPSNPGAVTGRLASITLRTGGTISYAYTGANNGINCSDGTTAGLTRSIAAVSGSSGSSTTYVRSSSGAKLSHTDAVDGQGNATAYDFVSPNNAPAGTSGLWYETQRSSYQGAAAGTALVTTATCYNSGTTVCSPPYFSLPITSISQVVVLDGVQQKSSKRTFDQYSGQVTQTDICDFGTANCSNPIASQVTSLQTLQNGRNVPLSTVWSANNTAISSTSYNYDESTVTSTAGVPNHEAVSGTRGNLTSVSTSVDGILSYKQTLAYADTGSLVASVDSVNGTTSLGYDSTYVYNTSVTPPVPASGASLGISLAFDAAHTGLPVSATDANSSTTTISSYDALLRPKEVDTPLNGKVTYNYTPNQTSQFRVMSAGTEDTETIADSYGRTIRIALATGQGSNPWNLTDTCYDATGRVAFTSVRYQGGSLTQAQVCTGSGDSYAYDALGRTTGVTHAGGGTASSTYKGRTSKFVDENGVTRLTQVDGAGRTTAVCEVTSVAMPNSGAPTACNMDIAATGYLTTYAYDLVNHQTTVNQGGQVRIFETDWLGRTTRVQEPESGITTYAYTQNATGLVVTRKRPRANQSNANVLTTTTTQYDKASRVLSISYDDGTPSRTYSYDEATAFNTGAISLGQSKGMLTGHAIASGMALEAFAYDSLGRVKTTIQCEPSNCANPAAYKSTAYTYDQIGNPQTVSDGAGFTARYGYTIASQPVSLTSALNANPPTTLVSSALYGALGSTTISLGNNINISSAYDQRGNLNYRTLRPSNNLSRLLYGMSVDWSGQRAVDAWDTVLNQVSTFGYDDVNRLTAKTVTSGATQNFTYTYDRWGNRTSQTALQSGPSPANSFSVSNQITTNGFTYDAVGNVVTDGFHTYSYDAENNVVTVDGGSTTYTYNALNQRVRVAGSSGTREFVFHPNGSRASTFDGFGNFVSSQNYLGRTPVAFYATGSYHYQHQDWLGTERLRTSSNGSVEGSYSSLAFGDGYSASGSDADPSHYTGLDNDASSGTIHALFRQYSPQSGRWMSPDPYAGSYDSRDPQSLNRYVYALNNPLSLRDPSGLTPCDYGSSDYGGEDYEDAASNDECKANGGTPITVEQSISVDGNDGSGTYYYGTVSGNNRTVIQTGKFAPSNQKPEVCGGTFEFGGKEVDLAEGGGFSGVIHENDSVSGNTVGHLGEGWVGGEGPTIGIGKITAPGNALGGWFGFEGVGITAGPLAGIQVGVAGGLGWGGAYFEGHIWGFAVGSGVYASTSCKKGG